jgi:hypothetical protein
MSTVPFIFAGNTGNIPLSQLDANFANAKSAADFVIANNQANITSVGTLTGLSVNGNILGNGAVSIAGNTTIGNNLSVVGTITAAGNTIHGNIFTTGLITATGDITGGNIITGGNVLSAGVVSATGNVTGNNILTTGLVSATGNVTGGNVFSAGLVSATGSILTAALISATGNVTGGNVFSAGLVSATGNILTSGSISATGNFIARTLDAVDMNLSGNIVVAGNATVNGTTTTINVQTLNIADKDVVVANNVSSSALINGAGILAGNPTVASIIYSDAIKGWTTANNFSVGANLTVTGTTTLTGIPTAPTPGNTVADTQIATTAFVRNIVPTGVITLWYGAIVNIPSGWFLCDGTNGTPDLRNRFIVGAGSTYAVEATGGSANATLPSHSHTATSSVTDPGHAHSYNQPVASNAANPPGSSGSQPSATVTGNAITGISVSTTISTAGSSATNANLPPYYALAYIMKA